MADDKLQEICDRVDGPRMMANLAVLAKWIKLSGTPEEAISLDFLRSKLDELGYATKVYEHDAYISLPGPARLTADGEPIVAITHSMAQPTGSKGLKGTVLDLGASLDEEFRKRDLSGRIILVDGIADAKMAVKASRAGVAAHIHVSPHDHLHEMCLTPVWGNPSLETVSNLPSTVSITISASDGKRLRDKLSRNQAVEVEIYTEVDTGWRVTPLLVADLPSASASNDEPFVMFSGHHDTWHHGVMDNGTANVLMLEAARIFSLFRKEWRRGLRLCFWSGHSHGGYTGSAWYADQYWDELDRRCVAHVNIDSPGGVGADDLTEVVVTPELQELAADAVYDETGQKIPGKRKVPNADESFRGIGIPAVFNTLSKQPIERDPVRNRLGWWWHTPDDLIDKVDEKYLVRDTRIVMRVVWQLLTQPVLPLDYERHAAALTNELERISDSLNKRLSIDDLIESAANVRSKCSRLRELGGKKPEVANDALMKVARALVPMDYTAGDRFEHEPVLSMPWPVLQPLRQLALVAEDKVRLARVGAVRAGNRLAYSLRLANAALDEAIAQLA